ncbi:MAG: hypothetical protein LBF91_01875 [Azoarcus sp.]|nr:hypothetical protein [Azoarcus sp.]
MKTPCAIALTFCLIGTVFAEGNSLPDLETSDDLRAFLERGVICEDAWSANTMFMHRHDLAALRKLDVMVRKMGLLTELSIAKDHYSLNIHPGEIKIHGLDVENILIGAYDSITFEATLKADKKTVLGKLSALGLDQYPFEHPVGDDGESYFDNKKIAGHVGSIMVGDNCVRATAWDEGNQSCQAEKTPVPHGSMCWAYRKFEQENRAKNKACQAGKASVTLGCVWHDL